MALKPLTIEDNGFLLEQNAVGASTWDLSVKKTVSHKDGTVSSDWKNIAYSISMYRAIEMIILFRMSARRTDDTPMTLNEFFINYLEERKATIERFKLTSINLSKDLCNL